MRSLELNKAIDHVEVLKDCCGSDEPGAKAKAKPHNFRWNPEDSQAPR